MAEKQSKNNTDPPAKVNVTKEEVRAKEPVPQKAASSSIEYFADSVLKKPESINQLMDDQTTMQPVIWRCRNKECVPPKAKRQYFEFESDQPKCPKCTSGPPSVTKRSLIHFLLEDPTGLIGAGRLNPLVMVCDLKRDYVATPTNGEAGTVDPSEVNCPGCIERMKEAISRRGGLKLNAMTFKKQTLNQ